METLKRRTLKLITFYPSPKEIYDLIVKGEGWNYSFNREYFLKRDRALVATIYLLALRISEALRLRKNQFLFPEETGYEDRVVVRGIKLSKSRFKDKPRREQYRQEAWLPLVGPRKPLTMLVLDWLNEIENPEARIFPIDRRRAYQVVVSLTGYPPHWFRAFGEDYLYNQWEGDLLAVSSYIKVDVRTLQQYIRRQYEKYPVV